VNPELVLPHILYVEDDINLSFVTRDNLEMAGFSVQHCTTGAEGWTAFVTPECPIDLCLLDVMLPETDGFSLARQIRTHDPDVPILFLSARADRTDRLTGLRLGADDYLTKPFSIDELILKINVFLRRSQPQRTQQTHPAWTPPARSTERPLGTFRFDAANLTLRHGSESANDTLTQREADVLTYLLDRANTIVRRDELLRAIWGNDDYYMGRSLDVFISRLRKRLTRTQHCPDPQVRIESVHGVGFRLMTSDER
jgi:DNA-binding response OmpR family regulator